MNAVQQLMADLGAGRVGLPAACEVLPRLLVPAGRRPPAADTAELLAREQDDRVPPYTPGSWDDVYDAYTAHQVISGEQYAALYRFAAAPR